MASARATPPAKSTNWRNTGNKAMKRRVAKTAPSQDAGGAEMETLYLDIFSGISGDMFIGALLDLGVDPHDLEHELEKLKLDDYHLHVSRAHKAAIEGVKFDVHTSKLMRMARRTLTRILTKTAIMLTSMNTPTMMNIITITRMIKALINTSTVIITKKSTSIHTAETSPKSRS
jgi:hypothetical protein